MELTQTTEVSRLQASAPAFEASRESARLLSLDVFRGATVVGMELVNNPGAATAVYPQLAHATWNGWTFADTIAPAFLWIVGVAIAFALAGRKHQADGARPLWRVARRTLILFGLGLLLAAIPQVLPLLDLTALATVRVPGTLQRIALCYFAASVLALYTGWRTQAVVAAGLLALYWSLMLLAPVPGVGAGVLQPGLNLANYVDQLLLGAHAKRADPLGILSTLPAISTTLFGVLAGHLLRLSTGRERALGLLVASGLGLALAGWALGVAVPINKNLWTPSYTLLMAGLATLAFAVCYWLVDLRRMRAWTTPLVMFGKNAIVVFVLSGALRSLLYGKEIARPDGSSVSLGGYAYELLFLPLGEPVAASLLFAIAWVLMFAALTYVLYRMRWFVKI